MRLGLVVPALAGDGGVPAVARFIKDTVLKTQTFELKLVSLSMSSDDPCSLRLFEPSTWMRGVICAAGEWESLPFTHVGAFLGEFEFQRYRPRRALSRVLSDCDLIQVVCGSPAWANAVVGLGKPVALQVATRARIERRLRDANPRSLPEWWRKAMTEITDRMDACALSKVDAIQVENPWMFEYARKINAEREVDLRYAPPGIDTVVFCPAGHRNLRLDPYILCVARLDDIRKNVVLLLEAYAQLPETLQSKVELVLAGFSPPSENFWRRAAALGVRERIRYVARPGTQELVSLYQQSSVFALSSDEEGLGVALLEAMACGVPVVATQCGGPDGIVTNGEDGYLVPVGDAKRMAGRLEYLLSDLPHNLKMGLKARLTIERRYDEQIVGEVFIDMWERMGHRASSA